MKTAPYELLRAQNAVMNTSTNELKTAERLVLFALVGHVSLKAPLNPIYAKKETLAKEVGKSTPTIWRALSSLVTKGFISKSNAQTRHNRSGRFGSSLYVLTSRALEMLGIRIPVSTKEADGDSRYTPKRGIPDDLTELKSLLSMPAIFKLMGMATKNKKKLADIVSVKIEAIKKLKGAQLFALISHFITQNEDFANQAKKAVENKEKQLNEEFNKKTLISFVLQNSGKQFTDGSSVFQVDASSRNQAFVVQMNGSNQRWAPLTTDFVDDIRTGKLSPFTGAPVIPPSRDTLSTVRARLAELKQAIKRSK